MRSHRDVIAGLAVLVPVALVAACAGEVRTGPPPAAEPAPTTTTVHHPVDRSTAPSPFIVSYDGHALELGPHTYCNATECVDGVDLEPEPIGSPGEIRVEVTERGLAELDVQATDDVLPDGTMKEDADWSRLPAQPQGGGVWLVRPDAPAGDYLVSLSARGDSGDMVADLRWEIVDAAG
ncbi:hypothetical protein [Myceligenerans indicum]|uniref:Lipoprotein n=1 Tax=Myceligenerans indicum TaxID=2593663 RepID=A0ABS1LIJ6_9MICO|nr:hypothetical protein [Myceligenerans indicum]MBL0886027.1 hypothetical protein [Myceligenerans indicum]